MATMWPIFGSEATKVRKVAQLLEDAVISIGYKINGSATPAQNAQEIDK